MALQRVELKNTLSNDFAFDEAIKTLRTNIRFCGKNIRTIMLTSSTPNEGKSSIALALAASLAEAGQETLLIDADIRKSVMVTRYELDQDVFGLSQFLSGQKDMDDVLYHTNLENLDVIFSGPYSPNPAELLEEPGFKKLVQGVREEYDFVIIDTPPITSVIDAAIVAKECDGAALVIESGTISYRTAQRVMKQLEKSGCRILGAVLNKVGGEHSGYYSKYYGRYGQYGKVGPYAANTDGNQGS